MYRINFFRTVLLLLTSINPVFAQYQNILIGNAINSYEPEEPSIVINPVDTDQILVGANTDNYYYSVDGGYTWQSGVLTSSYGVGGDPCVLSYENDFYYFHLVPDLSRVVCQKTSSLGGSWSDGSYTGINGTKDNDKEWAVVDHSNGNIYVTWAQFDEHGSSNPLDSSEIQLSRSTDAGITWSNPVVVSDRKGNAQGGNYSDHAPMPAIGPNNEVYVAWWGPDGLMFDKSTDEGLTWLESDINVTGFHINWLVFNVPGVQIVPGFPIINCDLSSGIYNGNIYICWTDQRSGFLDTDVWITKSTDGGINWSSPIRVNDDPPNRHQFFAWMTIDQTNGYLYFIFYDRRNHTTLETDVYMAVSSDGGNSFLNFKISESPFIPSINDFLGHYIGVSAHNNVVRPVWTRIDNNAPSLWIAIIDSITNIEDHSEIIELSNYRLFQNFPNPFNPSTTISFSIPNEEFVSLKVYNSLGEEVAELVNEIKPAGNYSISFSAEGGYASGGDVSSHSGNIPNLTSGIYLYRLQAGNYVETKKMLLLR